MVISFFCRIASFVVITWCLVTWLMIPCVFFFP
jgi:hypothetical protein